MVAGKRALYSCIEDVRVSLQHVRGVTIVSKMLGGHCINTETHIRTISDWDALWGILDKCIKVYYTERFRIPTPVH